MFSRLKGRNRHGGVLIGGCANIYHINIGIVKHCLKRRIGFNSFKVGFVTLWSKISLNAPPVTVKLFWVPTANRGNLGATEFFCGKEMNHAHETNSRQTNSDHDISPIFEAKKAPQ